jgi:hypothetical protein
MLIWGRYENKPPEKIDDIPKREVNRMLYEYKMAFAALPGQHSHDKWKLWIGRRKDEPSAQN